MKNTVLTLVPRTKFASKESKTAASVCTISYRITANKGKECIKPKKKKEKKERTRILDCKGIPTSIKLKAFVSFNLLPSIKWKGCPYKDRSFS
jgi:hypothetical protein